MNSKDQLNLSQLHQEKLAKYSSSVIKRGLILAQNIQGEYSSEFLSKNLNFLEKVDDVDILFSQGIFCYKQGNAQKSIEFFSKILEKCPNHVSSLCFRGFAFSLLEDAQNSLKDLEKVVEINPADSSIHIIYAKVVFHSLVGNNAIAQRKSLEILHANIYEVNVCTSLDLFFRAFTRWLIGDKQGSLEDCNQALLIDPDNVIVRCYQGIILSETSNPQEAIKSLTDALTINPNHIKADITFWSRGFSYYQLNNFTEAIEDFSSSLEINSSNARVHLYRGLAHVATGNFILAQKDIDRGLKIDTDFCIEVIKAIDSSFNYVIAEPKEISQLFVRAGDIHYESENYQDAIEDYSYALNLDPNNTKAYINRELALIDYDLEKPKEKSINLSEFNEKKSSFLAYVYTVARICKTLDEIAELDPDTADTLRQSFLKGLHSA